MKVAILAGGYGSRLADEAEPRPKPMVEIGGVPILWHIMRYYAHFGFREFVIALGYKGEQIKRYATNFASLAGNIRVDYGKRSIAYDAANAMDGWSLDLVETGLLTQTGGRIKRLRSYLGGETFFLTWGDSLSDVNLHELLRFHKSHGKLATMTAVRPPARFGHLELDGQRVVVFDEKPQAGEGWINGAYFALEPQVLDYIDGDATQFESEPLHRLAMDGELMAFRHRGFWLCMDSVRDKRFLERLWQEGQAPWKPWD